LGKQKPCSNGPIIRWAFGPGARKLLVRRTCPRSRLRSPPAQGPDEVLVFWIIIASGNIVDSECFTINPPRTAPLLAVCCKLNQYINMLHDCLALKMIFLSDLRVIQDSGQRAREVGKWVPVRRGDRLLLPQRLPPGVVDWLPAVGLGVELSGQIVKIIDHSQIFDTV
jgi:hypothetical protein